MDTGPAVLFAILGGTGAVSALSLLPAEVQQALAAAKEAQRLGEDAKALQLYNIAIPASVKYLKGVPTRSH